MQPDIEEAFDTKLKLEEESAENNESKIDNEKIDSEEEEDEDDDDHGIELVDATDEDFSFVCGVLTSPIAAEEAFDNGQIRPFFPLFNRDLLLSDIDFQHLKNRSPLDKIFIQTEDNNNNNNNNKNPLNLTKIANNEEQISGPYCEWSNKSTTNPSDQSGSCKKSNSTGFSKLWRFRDFINRSNSDGRDAFVFLNPTTTTTTSSSSAGSNIVKKEKVISSVDEVKKVTTEKNKKIKKSEAVLAHEAYMKSRARDKERLRRSRPDPFGFFTNVNGGLTRNVHPF